jgi:C4-dicarboxylate transporter DctQ subunit
MLAKAMTVLRAVERILIAVILIAMSLLYFINVVVRGTSPKLATELAWIEEATLFAFAWLVFVGLGLALEQRRHIAMTAFVNSRRPRIAAAIQKIINLVGLVFCVFLTKSSFDLAVFIYNSGQVSPTLGFSVVGLYAPLPVGFALLGLRYLLELLGVQDRSKLQVVAMDH